MDGNKTVRGYEQAHLSDGKRKTYLLVAIITIIVCIAHFSSAGDITTLREQNDNTGKTSDTMNARERTISIAGKTEADQKKENLDTTDTSGDLHITICQRRVDLDPDIHNT